MHLDGEGSWADLRHYRLNPPSDLVLRLVRVSGVGRSGVGLRRVVGTIMVVLVLVSVLVRMRMTVRGPGRRARMVVAGVWMRVLVFVLVPVGGA